MNQSTKQPEASALSLMLQPALWFLLMTSTLACASHVALNLIS